MKYSNFDMVLTFSKVYYNGLNSCGDNLHQNLEKFIRSILVSQNRATDIETILRNIKSLALNKDDSNEFKSRSTFDR